MEDKYKEIGKLLRKSIDADYCYDCPFNKFCDKVYKEEEKNFNLSCDSIRIMAIEKELKKFDKNT